VVKIVIGLARTIVYEDGCTMQSQRSADTWEVEVPDDGSEFLSSIWMVADGLEVLRLPLTMGSVLTDISERT
jgi:hypothetical protein